MITFVDANTDAGGSTIALRELSSGELKWFKMLKSSYQFIRQEDFRIFSKHEVYKCINSRSYLL